MMRTDLATFLLSPLLRIPDTDEDHLEQIQNRIWCTSWYFQHSPYLTGLLIENKDAYAGYEGPETTVGTFFGLMSPCIFVKDGKYNFLIKIIREIIYPVTNADRSNESSQPCNLHFFQYPNWDDDAARRDDDTARRDDDEIFY